MTAIYDWPVDWVPSAVAMPLEPNVREFVSPFSNAWQGLDLLGERFRQIITLPPCGQDVAAEREAFFNRLRGANLIRAPYFKRPTPRGTISGSVVLQAALLQGAATISLGGITPGTTLKAGDMLGVGNMLLQIAESTTVDGAGHTITSLANRAREAASAGTAVVINRPTAQWRLASPVVPVTHLPGRYADSLQLELIETWG